VRWSRSSVALIIVVICAALLAVQNIQLQQDYSTLSLQYADLQKNYTALSSEYAGLQESYYKLESQYSSLERSYSSLSGEYQSLMSRYTNLSSEYNSLISGYTQLNGTVAYMIHTMNAYSLVKQAVPRVLNSDAVGATAPAVSSAGVSKSDYWGSIQKIYEYVTSNIKYANDIEMPLWYVSSTTTLNGQDYICKAEYFEYQNYVQTPELTLNIRQGDCDDQAVLAYAMIKQYMRGVYGTDYAFYLAYVLFSGGGAHMAVVMPVQGGNICIVDPAGRYLTSTWYGKITSKPALQELQAYSNYWTSEGRIKYMELWSVTPDGSPSVVAEGTLEEVARALG
jgi:hypothetical protein